MAKPDVYKRRERRVHCCSVYLDPPDGDDTMPENTSVETIRQWLHSYYDKLVDEVIEKVAQYPGAARNIIRYDYSIVPPSYPEESPAGIIVNGYRLETDGEYTRRIAAYEAKQKREAQREKRQRETELRLLVELKAKYPEE